MPKPESLLHITCRHALEWNQLEEVLSSSLLGVKTRTHFASLLDAPTVVWIVWTTHRRLRQQQYQSLALQWSPCFPAARITEVSVTTWVRSCQQLQFEALENVRFDTKSSCGGSYSKAHFIEGQNWSSDLSQAHYYCFCCQCECCQDDDDDYYYSRCCYDDSLSWTLLLNRLAPLIDRTTWSMLRPELPTSGCTRKEWAWIWRSQKKQGLWSEHLASRRSAWRVRLCCKASPWYWSPRPWVNQAPGWAEPSEPGFSSREVACTATSR